MGAKKKFAFRFEAVNWTYAGTNGGFSNFDFASNLVVAPNSGYTATVLDIVRDDANQRIDFNLEFTPEFVAAVDI